jgi:ABC-type transporter Mla subunit MlaD
MAITLPEIKVPTCGSNEALDSLNDALGGASDAINDALDDINGAIADIEGQLADAQGKLESAIGDALAEVKTFKGEVAKLLTDKLNPLVDDNEIADKIAELKEEFGDAMEDIDKVFAKVQSALENPFDVDLCEALPNIEAGGDGPIAKATEAAVPAVDAAIETIPLVRPTFTSIADSFRENGTVVEAPDNLVYQDSRPVTTGSGSVTIADLTTNNSIPYTVQQDSVRYGLTVAQINENLQRLADEIISPIKDEFPDLIITHGFRSEHVELKNGSYVPRSRVGGSHHYGGWACDFKFSGVTSKDELIDRANRIRQILPQWTQFILEYPGRYQNSNYLLHIAYVPYDPRNQVITMLSNGTNVNQEFV